MSPRQHSSIESPSQSRSRLPAKSALSYFRRRTLGSGHVRFGKGFSQQSKSRSTQTLSSLWEFPQGSGLSWTHHIMKWTKMLPSLAQLERWARVDFADSEQLVRSGTVTRHLGRWGLHIGHGENVRPWEIKSSNVEKHLRQVEPHRHLLNAAGGTCQLQWHLPGTPEGRLPWDWSHCELQSETLFHKQEIKVMK